MLIGNHSVLMKSPNRFIGGSTTSVEPQLRSNWNKNGMNRNRQYPDQSNAANPLIAVPTGYYLGSAWVLPQKSGMMSSINQTKLSITTTGTIVGGITATGSASMLIDTNTPTVFPLDDSSPARTGSASFSITASDLVGGLITSGAGTASFAITTNTPLLTASIGGEGTASFAITTNTPLLGAIADGAGSASFAITTNTPVIYPLNDASPARTGSATMTFSGSLIPYAIGQMAGSTVDNTTMNPTTVANAVWDAEALAHALDGTMGKLLGTAGSGGVDYDLLAAAILSAAQTTPIAANMKKTNDQTIIGDGTENNKFRSHLVP